ncbi:hypothetical protein BGZ99_001272 [Dissophora globulifera]|uniref:F-box domain-containing protein n=1 Tax=Dissophora globulifera TaxID=979702 RepID=A0A9P6UJE2_9FUNG|nr:hypothetical protein BGZ99_001272 [Dissophora globulifera]
MPLKHHRSEENNVNSECKRRLPTERNLSSTTHADVVAATRSYVSPTLPYHLPVEVWETICSYLRPSQLARLSRVSKALYEIVCGIRFWKNWYLELAKEKEFTSSDLNVDSLDDYHPAVYMLYILSKSFILCEQCRKSHAPKSYHRVSTVPLPVKVVSSVKTPRQRIRRRNQLKVDQALLNRDSNLDDSSDSGDSRIKSSISGSEGDTQVSDESGQEAWTIRLCLNCRKEHYTRHVERYPPGLRAKVYNTQQMEELFRFGRRINHINPDGVLMTDGSSSWMEYSAYHVLGRARAHYGGDIGIAHIHNDHQESLEKMKGRVEHLRRKLPLLKKEGEALPPLKNLWALV